jgi:hypothetical protein
LLTLLHEDKKLPYEEKNYHMSAAAKTAKKHPRTLGFQSWQDADILILVHIIK